MKTLVQRFGEHLKNEKANKLKKPHFSPFSQKYQLQRSGFVIKTNTTLGEELAEPLSPDPVWK